ncbi:MAG: ATP-binding protein [Anaerovoracaceae bacterium]
MIRKIIKINEEKCNGCGLCAEACHEGAIGMVNGKAKLLRDDYCDGLGDCLPVCPTDAISFEEREAEAYNEEAVLKNMASKNQSGISVQNIDDSKNISLDSMLKNWPVQIKLAPVKAPYFDKADLLIAADCCAYAYGDFHREFIRNKITLIGCPKLDMIDYSEKLAEIIKSNDINSITLTRMEVPCCGGLEYAVNAAIKESGKNISLKVITVCIDGNLK